jgi:hypothetical protein
MTPYVISDNTGATYSGTDDTYLLEGNSGSNFGSATTFIVKAWTTNDRAHTVLKYTGLSNVPAGTVSNGAIRLYLETVANFNFGSRPTINAYALRRAFVENQATWNIAATGTNWGTAGALNTANDYNNTLLGSVFINAQGAYFEITGAAVDSYIQSIVNGGTDYGLLLVEANYLAPANIFNEAVFTSSEGTNGQRPELTFDLSSSNTNFTDSITENLSLADSSTQLSTYAVSRTENLGVADSSTQVYAYTSSVTENLSLADIISAGNNNFTNTVTENLALVDTPAITVQFVVTRTEPITLADTSAITVQFVVTRTEPITLADNSTQLSTYTTTINENITLADIISAGSNNFTNIVTENISVADTLAVTLQFDLSRVEDISLTDSSSVASQLLISIIENVSNADTLAAQTQSFVSINENFTILETVFTPGWVTIIAGNVAVWNPINDAQTDSWTDVVDTQNPNWINIIDNQ